MNEGVQKNTWVDRDLEEVDLLKIVNYIMMRSEVKKQDQDSVIQYRDLELDYNKLQYRVVPEDQFQPLSLKEAQLLKWFMKHPDQCWTREKIRKAVVSIEKMTGTRPYGWYCRYAPSVNTRKLLIEEGGFLYDSDSYADELPYWVLVNEKPHLIIPYTLETKSSIFTIIPVSSAISPLTVNSK